MWLNSSKQVTDKHVQQLIAFAGSGRLKDSDSGAPEFRAFLSNVPSSFLHRYANECLESSFTDSGFALQDIVNEVGARIGAKVTPGRYRGAAGKIGFDGLWQFPSGHSLIVEVKTTDAYRIDLSKITGYQRALEAQEEICEDASSVLIVVGRQDTGDLEAQIRGSRFAWDIRLISVEALFRLVVIKEELEDPSIIQRIHQILVPREFTRLDEIADILFSTAEEIKQEEADESEETDGKKSRNPKFTPVAFHQPCIDRITKYLGVNLIKRSRAKYSTPDGSTVVNCAISKEHDPDKHPNYWFAFHPHQREFLLDARTAYVAFGCGSQNQLLLIPFTTFEKWLNSFWTTEKGDKTYWHVVIHKDKTRFFLHRKKGNARIDLSEYIVPITSK